MDSHVTNLIARREDAVALLRGAHSAGNDRLVKAYGKIVGDWNRMLAAYGIPPEL